MPGYKISSVISARLDAAATGHPWCTRSTWLPGHNGATAGYLKIGATTPNSPDHRWAVLISGGLHARELAPPDALVSFVEKLIAAYAATSDIVYPAWTAPDGTVYSSFTIPWPQIRSVVERLDLYVAPVVNADGRDWVLATLPVSATSTEQRLHKEWRKNRRPAPAGRTGDFCVGVDINRNFNIVWDFKKYYTPTLAAAAPLSGISGSYDPCHHEVYIGPGPSGESEPETQNLAGLMRSANISFFLDVHAYGRDVLFSWGLETSQSNDDSQNFANPAFDGKRDGNDPSATAYAEYVPATDLAAAQAMAQRMADFILKKAGGSDPTAQSRSAYRVLMNGLLYPGSICTGLSVDYCFSRWFSAAKAGNPISPVMAFTLEVGGDPRRPGQDEGGFAPNYVTQYPKIEREVHAAVWGLLTAVAATSFVGPTAPAPPSSSGKCFIAGAAYGDPLHPSVTFLRDVRDRQLPVGRGGRAFAAALNCCYAVLSPPMARRLQRHPAAAAAVRAGLLDPLVAVLRLVSRVTGGRPRLRAVLLATTFLAAAIAAAAIAVALGAALVLAAKGVR